MVSRLQCLACPPQQIDMSGEVCVGTRSHGVNKRLPHFLLNVISVRKGRPSQKLRGQVGYPVTAGLGRRSNRPSLAISHTRREEEEKRGLEK